MTDRTAKESFALAEGVSAVVIAGAGTGKTTRLIGEIISLVEMRDVPIERILAVTFSDSAAADMKQKLTERLELRFTETSDHRFRTALNSLARVQISTIHSLAQRILRENPFEAGIDPAFTIEEESSDILLADELWRLWAKRAFWGGTPFDDDLVMLLGYMSAEGLKEIALTLAARPDRLPDYFDHRVNPQVERQRLEARLGDIRQSLSTVRPSVTGADPLHDRFNAVLGILTKTDLDEIDRGYRLARIVKRGGSKSRWSDHNQYEAVKRLIDGPDGAVDTLRELGTFLSRLELDAVTHTAVRVLSDFVKFSRAEKRRRGLLSFFDLIWEARNLLEKNLSVRTRYQEEFDYILVDEFQDIDPILGDIVLLLAENGAKAAGPGDVRLRPGKLFIVGDPKQSIYRFREADVGVFFAVMEKIRESGGRVDLLDTSYRSQQHLVLFQNAFFDRYIRHEDDRYAITYSPLKPRVPDLTAADRNPAVRVVNSDPASSKSAEEVRSAEADFIAAQINDLTQKKVEGRIVRDRETGIGRDVEYRDIAILFRSLASVSSLYEEALKRAGIPYFIVGGRGYFQRQEIYDVTNILRAVFDPSDRRATIGALRSPAFGIDDLTLYEAARRGALSYLGDERDGPVGQALLVLRRLHDCAFRLTLPQLLSEVYRAIPIVEVNALGPGGAQRVGNLIKITETARALESRGPVILSAFLKLLTRLSLEREDEGEAAVTEEARNAVRIMTIHAAKGLEFPVVFVPDLGRKRKTWNRDGIFINRSDVTVSGARLGPVADLGYYNTICRHEDNRAAAEERRLLYVAATRARDRLILVGSRKEETSHQCALLDFFESFDSRGSVPAVLQGIDPETSEKYSFRSKRARLGDLLSGTAERTLLELVRQGEEQREAEYRRAAGRRLFSFVTEGKQEEAAIGRPAPAADAEGIGRKVGTVVHEVLSLIDFSGDDRADMLVERAVAALGLPPDVRDRVAVDARLLIDGFLGSEIGREIRSSRIIGREIPILTRTNGMTVTGRIDIAYETSEGIIVLDYKTDAVAKNEEAALAERYRGQITAYTAALTDAIKRDISVKGGVFFLRTKTAAFF